MRSKIFGIVPILMCFICIISLFGCYIGIRDQFESDGLLKYYKIPHNVDKFGNEVYALVGNENINLPENLYIPPTFNGGVVLYVNYYNRSAWGGGKYYFPQYRGVKKIYYSYNSLFFNTTEIENENTGKEHFIPAMFFNMKNYEIVNNLYYKWIVRSKNTEKIFLTRKIFDICLSYEDKFLQTASYQGLVLNVLSEFVDKIIQIANTTYLFNYEGSPNEDVFFINNFERGGLIEDVPYKPTREGYEFGGWYKEPECVNKWNFEIDTLSAPDYDNDGELIFKETKLYAKWI